MKVIDESIKENDQPYRKTENIKVSLLMYQKIILQLMMTKLMHVIREYFLAIPVLYEYKIFDQNLRKQIFSYLFHKQEME